MKIVERKFQIESIKQLIDSTESSAFITGLHSTGKTCVTKSIFDDLYSDRVAWINCAECLEPKVLYERALRQWTGEDLSCSNTDSFVYSIQQLANDHETKELRRFLILDKCDELLDLNSNTIFQSLFKLSRLTKVNICVIFISHLKWDDLLSKAPTFPPRKIDFATYNEEDTMKILLLDCPKGEKQIFYRVFAQLVYDTFKIASKDLSELRYLCSLLFPKYIEPVLQGIVKRAETSKLFTNLSGTLKKHLHSLYLRDVSCIEWQSHLDNQSIVTTASKRIDMPYMTKFLVIASFLASYNPQKYDARFFTRGGEGKKKVGKKGGVHNGALYRNQLNGPCTFAVERMLAIFYSILEQDCKMSFDIHSQIATCVSLKLLVRVSAVNRLDMMRCKCNVSFPFVKAISKSVRFDIVKFLFDWVDV